MKSWLIGKDSDAGRDWGQEEKGTTEDEMAGWHHGLNGHEFEWTLGVGDGQGGLAFCNLWGRKESDMTEQLNWTELKVIRIEFSLNRIHGLIKQGREKPLYKLDKDTNSRHQQSKKTILSRTGPCCYSNLRFPISTTITTSKCLLLEPVYGTLLQQLGLTTPVGNTW